MEHEVTGLLGMALVGLQKKVILKVKLGSKKAIFLFFLFRGVKLSTFLI